MRSCDSVHLCLCVCGGGVLGYIQMIPSTRFPYCTIFLALHLVFTSRPYGNACDDSVLSVLLIAWLHIDCPGCSQLQRVRSWVYWPVGLCLSHLEFCRDVWIWCSFTEESDKTKIQLCLWNILPLLHKLCSYLWRYLFHAMAKLDKCCQGAVKDLLRHFRTLHETNVTLGCLCVKCWRPKMV